MHTKKMLFAISLFLISIPKIYSQTDSSSYKNEFQFMLVDGYSFSYVNFISEESAIRYMVNINVSAGGTDGNSETTYVPDTNPYDENKESTETERDYQSIGFYPSYVIYPIKESIFRMYVGGGPYLLLQRTFSKYKSDWLHESQETVNKHTSETLNYSINLGMTGIIGVECSISQKISLLAEYGIYAHYGWYKDKWTSSSSQGEYNSSRTTDKDGTQWSVGLAGVKLGITFLF